jgi:hypothetical protein
MIIYKSIENLEKNTYITLDAILDGFSQASYLKLSIDDFVENEFLLICKLIKIVSFKCSIH